MPRRRRAWSFAPLVIAVTLAACTQPSPTVPAPILVVTPVSGITISGLPSSVTVGQSVQLTASVVLPDGTQKLALDATWKSSDTTVATISTTGLLTATGPGNADVTSTFQGVRGLSHVLVSKPSPPLVTYDISGVVHESAPTEEVVVPGATVGIHFVGCPSCPHDNQTTMTDASGHFTLPGIDTAGFALVVSTPGYDQAQYGVVLLPRDQHPDIALNPTCRYAVNPPSIYSDNDNIIGGYFDVITAPGCSWAVTATPQRSFSPSAGFFRFTSPVSGTGPGRVTFDSSSGSYAPDLVVIVEITGPTGHPAFLTIFVAGE